MNIKDQYTTFKQFKKNGVGGVKSNKTLKHFQQRIYLIFIWNNLHFIQKSLENRLRWPWGIRAHWLMRTQVNLLLTLTFVDMQHQNMLKRQSCIKMISRFFRARRIQAVSPNAYIVCLLCVLIWTHWLTLFSEYLINHIHKPWSSHFFKKNPGYHIKHLTCSGFNCQTVWPVCSDCSPQGCLREQTPFVS